MTFPQSLLLALSRAEAISLGFPKQVRSQDGLGPGPEQDGPGPAVVGHLVALRVVDPHVSGAVDVARPHLADFIWAAAGEPLDANHVGDDAPELRKRHLNYLVIHRPDQFRLSGVAATLEQTGQRSQGVVYPRRHEAFSDAPLDHVHNAANVGIDGCPDVAAGDPGLTDRLQLGHAEFGCPSRAVELPEIAQDELVDVDLGSRSPVLPVVDQGVLEEGSDQLGDCDAGVRI